MHIPGRRRCVPNRMELTAVIMGLKALKEPCKVTLTTDSKYVSDGISKGWAQSWKNNGWRKADKNAPCRSGDIVVGMDGDSATVKRLLIKDKKIIFMPENEAFEPIYPEDPMVLGKVIGSYRKY
ncbi:MAG: hypothetical protein IJF67_15700 [Clostridia bacterium]|nr:hypothetical protein [Clostridia bacterium]